MALKGKLTKLQCHAAAELRETGVVEVLTNSSSRLLVLLRVARLCQPLL
jgi:hypothetical protein